MESKIDTNPDIAGVPSESLTISSNPQTSKKNTRPYKKKVLLISLSIALTLLIAGVTIFVLIHRNEIETTLHKGTSINEDISDNNKDTTDDSTDNNKDTTDGNPDTVNPYIYGKDLDVSKYTDIKLTDYDDLAVFISEEIEEDPSIVSGIVYYFPMNHFYNPEKLLFSERFPPQSSFDTLYIVNRNNLVGEVQDANYKEAFDDIKQKNVSAEWLAEGRGYPEIFETALSTSPFYFLTKIEDVDYPNTDYTFAVLQLHTEEPAPADDSSYNGLIRVFAIKGDNLILAEFGFNLIQKLQLTEEDSQSCAEMTTTYSNEENYLAYNNACLTTLFQSGKYDQNLEEFTKLALEKFTILVQ